MKSLVTLQLAVLLDAGRFCATEVNLDAATIQRRVEHEGESFLTITLPTFSKALEKGLAEGRWPRQDATQFDHVRGLPAFMRGFLSLVFRDDGTLLDEPDAQAIWAVRQVCNLVGKMDRACSPARERQAMVDFVRTDRELGDHFRVGIPGRDLDAFERRFRRLFGDVLDKVETRVASFELIPRHGSGSVADGLTAKQKWDFPYFPERLESSFPSWRYTRNLPSWEPVPTVPLGAELPVKVISVPKTQSKPRIIAIEPSAMQYAQQALKEELYREIGRSPLREILGFRDQTRNQRMAHEASISGTLATLDLSEASDRVHLSVVIRAFRSWPHTLEYILACRSRTALIGGEEEILLHKFASMGSALTFPIEAMVFTTLASLGMTQEPTVSIRELTGHLSVYGDDIIVPVDAVGRVIALLEAFGFKVNERKSFWTGRFRESCGKEYYDGTDVSVVRLRADPPGSLDDAALIRRFVAFRNRSYEAGLWAVTRACDELLSGVIRVPHREMRDQMDAPSDVIALSTYLRTAWRAKWHTGRHEWIERYPKAVASTSSAEAEGEGGLLKWFFESHGRGLHQPDPFESQERAHTFRIKWASAIRLPKRVEVV